MKLNLSWLLLACSLTFIACDDSDDGDTAGTEMAGTEMAGTEMAGEMAGTEMAGEMAGTEMAGEMAGTEMAGTEMAGTEMAGTTMSGICNDVVEVGATCEPSNDCCARGSFCNPTSETEGQCVRNCEIPEDGDPVGCEARELCVENGEAAEGITPGYCLPSDNCEPGNENLACGEGEYHCLRVQNITLCIGDLAEARAEDPNLIVGEGEPCDVFNETAPTFCESGLTCESNGTERVCRSACSADADCGEGESCLDYSSVTDGLNYKFCSPRCELDNPDCGENGACVITDIVDDLAFGTCQEVGAENLAAAGESCNVFDSDAPTKFCAAGLSCEFNGVNYACNTVCNETVTCEEGETCYDASQSYNEAFQYSFCTTPCNPLDQDCADGSACAFSGVTDNAPTGTCVSEPAAGMGQNGDDCVSGDNAPYWGDCAANNVCFVDDEATGAGSCGSFCAEGRNDLCTGDYQACVDSAVDGLGLCAGACDIFSGNGCDEGESCLFSNEGLNAENNLTATGFCEENPDAGQVGVEETCVMGMLDVGDGESIEYPFLNNCPAGNICVGVAQGQPPICLEMCDPGAAENTCAGGLTCQGLFQGLDSVGVCFQ